ncbi:MAG: AbrB/MazE/SpoVT family DNA-binding domain-containing protein [Planktothrix sp. GU0601_MAG3]|nr:MAG: AbrB/MazE/SpoVT family DNA-binding domain-containing protein [Planktothrix sp. GU0601_MAG3]
MEATDINIQQMPILIGQKGEITIPQVIQDSLNINEGDNLILLQIGDLIVLTPQQPQVPQLIDQIATLMDNENVSLNDLLAGL